MKEVGKRIWYVHMCWSAVLSFVTSNLSASFIFQKHGAGVEKSHAGHVFKGTWKENRKHGEGVRKLRSNVEEIQVR
jgi:hypothetical protein